MKAEIIAVGTELLIGQTLDTNSHYLSKQLSFLGIDVFFKTIVGDNPGRIKQAMEIASKRADIVICTGGIGPTQDDVTKDVLSEFTGLPIEYHIPSLEKIKTFFERSKRKMAESNLRQALILQGSTPFFNDVGLAVGLAVQYQDTSFVLLPGPPRELTAMFEQKTVPWLKQLLPSEEMLYSKLLKFAGIGESSLEHELADLIEKQSDPTIAPYAATGEVTIRLSTKAASEEAAFKKMHAVKQEIYSRLKNHIYAEIDIPIEQVIIQLMTERELTLSAAESCTGGLFSELITAQAGSSDIFKGSIVCYSNEVKSQLLRVPESILSGDGAPGAVSGQCANSLAENVMNLTNTDVGVSFTGVAGPAKSEGKPVGLVYVGIAQKGHPTAHFELQLHGSRELIRIAAVKRALYELWKRLKQ